MTAVPDACPTFRIHFHDGTSLDVTAASSIIAEAHARKKRPGAFVSKIKLVRERDREACRIGSGDASKSKGCAE